MGPLRARVKNKIPTMPTNITALEVKHKGFKNTIQKIFAVKKILRRVSDQVCPVERGFSVSSQVMPATIHVKRLIRFASVEEVAGRIGIREGKRRRSLMISFKIS